MSGWKTWAGAAIMGASAVLKFLGYDELAELVLVVGTALGLIGLAHKVEKAGA